MARLVASRHARARAVVPLPGVCCAAAGAAPALVSVAADSRRPVVRAWPSWPPPRAPPRPAAAAAAAHSSWCSSHGPSASTPLVAVAVRSTLRRSRDGRQRRPHWRPLLAPLLFASPRRLPPHPRPRRVRALPVRPCHLCRPPRRPASFVRCGVHPRCVAAVRRPVCAPLSLGHSPEPPWLHPRPASPPRLRRWRCHRRRRIRPRPCSCHRRRPLSRRPCAPPSQPRHHPLPCEGTKGGMNGSFNIRTRVR
mmetsp:Transcript_37316/g.99001  ORF Transcript_37316/g.99001 Transcript_37316/m.99001 type:complete len:251 (-) Transcript_37316:88-840(-)